MRTLSVAISLALVAACTEQGPAGTAGEMGDPGSAGSAGAAGTDGESVTVTSEAAGSNCTAGGFKLVSSSGTAYVCNGVSAVAPVGSVVPFAGPNAPTGWLLCDGSAISRTTYATLFSVIGSSWGEGDNATTFNLPDMRGRFLRGTDHAAGHDPDAASRVAIATGGNAGDTVGSLQDYQLAAHSHTYGGAFTDDGSVVTGHIQGGSTTPFTVWGYGGTTSTVGGSESRPVNVSVNYIIKY